MTFRDFLGVPNSRKNRSRLPSGSKNKDIIGIGTPSNHSSEATATYAIEKSPIQLAYDNGDAHFLTVSITASIKDVAESVHDDFFESFNEPAEVDENNNVSEADSALSTPTDCTEQGLIYFTGWLAYKFWKEFLEQSLATQLAL
jgi:hypothetical protein